MKKVFAIVSLSLLAISFTASSCRKPKIDPCEGIECPPGTYCKDGECVEGRKR